MTDEGPRAEAAVAPMQPRQHAQLLKELHRSTGCWAPPEAAHTALYDTVRAAALHH